MVITRKKTFARTPSSQFNRVDAVEQRPKNYSSKSQRKLLTAAKWKQKQSKKCHTGRTLTTLMHTKHGWAENTIVPENNQHLSRSSSAFKKCSELVDILERDTWIPPYLQKWESKSKTSKQKKDPDENTELDGKPLKMDQIIQQNTPNGSKAWFSLLPSLIRLSKIHHRMSSRSEPAHQITDLIEWPHLQRKNGSHLKEQLIEQQASGEGQRPRRWLLRTNNANQVELTSSSKRKKAPPDWALQILKKSSFCFDTEKASGNKNNMREK